MKAILEGLLFVVGDEGLNIQQISNILDINEDEVKNLILELKKDYEHMDRGLRIDYLGNSLKLTTKKEHKEYYKKIMEEDNRGLSPASLETLAIIAYNEPITRIAVEEIRGVNSSQIIRRLTAKGFLKEVGREDTIGRAILYKTTDDFLDYFGLSSKEDLPELESSEEHKEEKDLFKSIYKEQIN